MGRTSTRDARTPGMKKPHMNENQFQQKVLDLCKWLGLKAYHTFDSRRSEPGFPDLVIVGKRGIIFAELKSTTGKVSLAQTEWLESIALAGGTAAIWRPEDWSMIQARLQELSGRNL